MINDIIIHSIVSLALFWFMVDFTGVKRAVIIVLIMGLCKEFYDWHIEWFDILGDVIGVLIGSLLWTER